MKTVGLILVILRVGLQILDINGWQTRQEQLQFLLVEDADESARDDTVEAFKEGCELLPDGYSHLHLTDQADIVDLVGLRHANVTPVGNLEKLNKI